MSPTSKLQLEAELLTIHFQSLLVKWGATQPLRNGLHASSVLVSDQEWCVREHVLHEIYPDQAVQQQLQTWDWKRSAIFENGWRLHQRWQDMFKRFGNVVWNEDSAELELDLIHYDETRNIYFSPDVILEFAGQRYVVEIKGIKQEAYQEIMITGDLETAMDLNETVNKAFYQANLYMHLLGLKRAILLIENKNNQDFKVWVIEYDKELSVKYIQRIYTVKGNVVNVRTFGLEKLYPRICHSRGDQRAKSCPMRDVCFSKEMEAKIE